MFLLLLNVVGWLWGTVAGFRNSVGWGLLKLCFYPNAPAIFGLRIRKELRRRSAKWALFSATCVVAWIVVAFVTFS